MRRICCFINSLDEGLRYVLQSSLSLRAVHVRDIDVDGRLHPDDDGRVVRSSGRGAEARRLDRRLRVADVR
jgi:hypothetical protein